MSYTVLARKFRSQTFDEVVGQQPVTKTLRNAIQQDRVHHGYLFCGTRGVGKTSMARILAKAMNCLATDKPTIQPCGQCEACVAIARGDDIDVIEIDAASNTGVDNIRELRSNAIYRPSRCRFKIYIIDEVHMLSTGAFNALLKTLEEPPEHVKFIFATTEAQKVPATILSRVQRFDFRSISAEEISGQLEKICQAEKVEVEEAALRRLARLARGSMRDAISLLDQVLSMGGDKITAEILDELFPAAHDELFASLIDQLAAGNAAGSLEMVDKSLSRGHTLDHWCSLLSSQIRNLMLLQVCGMDTELVDVPTNLRSQLTEQAKQFDSGTFVYMLTVLEELRRSVKSSGSGRALVEAAIVRLAEAAKFSSIESLLARVDPAAAASQPAAAAPRPAPRSAPAPASRPASAPARGVKKNGSAPVASVGNRSPVATERAPTQTASAQTPKPAPVKEKVQTTQQAPRVSLGSGRLSQADLQAAQAEPVIKAAMGLFEGQIVDIQRKPGVPPGDAQESDPNEE